MEGQEILNTNVSNNTELNNNSGFSGEIVINKPSSSIKSLEDFEKEVAALEKIEASNPKDENSASSTNTAPATTQELNNNVDEALTKTIDSTNEAADVPLETAPATTQESNNNVDEVLTKTIDSTNEAADAPIETAPATTQESNNNVDEALTKTIDSTNETAEAPIETAPATTQESNNNVDEVLTKTIDSTNEVNGEENANEGLEVVEFDSYENSSNDSDVDKEFGVNSEYVNDDDKMLGLMNDLVDEHVLNDEDTNTEITSETELPSNNESTSENETSNDSLEIVNLDENASNDSNNQNTNVDSEKASNDAVLIQNIAQIKKTQATNKSIIIGKNVKNFVLKVEKIKKMEIQDLLEVLYGKKKYTGLERKIVNSFIDEYIELKYYNKNEFKGYDDYCANVRVRLLDAAKKRYNESKSLEERNLVVRVTDFFLILNLVDSEEKFDINTRMLESNRLKFDNKVNVIKGLLKVFKYYDSLYESFLKKLKTSVFSLSVKQIDRNVELYNTNICSNIQFDEVFNRDVVTRNYNEDVTLENMREVQLRLLSARIVDEMLFLNQGKKYVISFPDSLYSKEKKLKSTLGLMNDIYSQSKIYIAITPELLNKNYKLISKLRKDGFRFVMELYSSYLEVIKDLKVLFAVCDYVVIIGYERNKKELSALLPSYLVDKVIYSDTSIHSGVIC